MVRSHNTYDITATNSETTTEAIDTRSTAFGGIIVPASVTAVAWYASATKTGTFLPIINQGGTAVSSTCTGSQAIPIPDEAMGWPYLKLVLTGVSSGTVTICLKD